MSVLVNTPVAGGGGGGGGVGLNATQTISAAGVGAAIPSLGATSLTLTFGAVTGTVTAAVVQLEDAATSEPLGIVYYPTGSPSLVDVASGITNFQFRTIEWSGTGSIPLTVAG